ncbi:MAG: 4'-phosphopantetheinyl transferase superfamily protein [Firmicutes bacterium]|nr:4'-phosphopantetheinyl transferase superfamily protein [[Eubacterium] siraeum]MCM1488541.1 4'-phosphopantetheinyl transferase superfamily protein [Bacillota bacterium]
MKNAKIYITATEGIDSKALDKAEALIPDWRREYSAKKRLSDRINSVFAYLLLQMLTEKEFGLKDQAPFTYKKADKPYFSQLDLFFSLSHCKTAVGAAASSGEIGFDIIDNRTVNEKAAPRICSPREWEQYQAAADRQQFLRQLWCKKESMVKQSGIGFTKGFDTADTAGESFFCCQRPDFYAALYFGACDGSEDLKTRLDAELTEIPWQQLI